MWRLYTFFNRKSSVLQITRTIETYICVMRYKFIVRHYSFLGFKDKTLAWVELLLFQIINKGSEAQCGSLTLPSSHHWGQGRIRIRPQISPPLTYWYHFITCVGRKPLSTLTSHMRNIYKPQWSISESTIGFITPEFLSKKGNHDL